MKRYLLVIVMALFVFTECAAATSISMPKNFDLTAITLQGAWLPATSITINNGASSNLNGGSRNFLVAGTLGMGGDVALQARMTTLNFPAALFQGNSVQENGYLGEANALYRIDKHVIVYGGVTYTFGNVNNITLDSSSPISSLGIQIGGMVGVPIYKDVSGFLDYSLGTQIAQFAIGLEYQVNSFSTVDLAYYNVQQYSLHVEGMSNTGYSMNGPALGLSFSI